MRRQYALPVTLIAAAVALIFLPAFSPVVSFAGQDFFNLLYPQATIAKLAFLRGSIPLWNWHSWGGCPFLAPMQAGVLYPPMWLTLALPLRVSWALQLNILGHLTLAGAGAAALARRYLQANSGASIFCGIAYAASGFVFGHFEQVNSVAAIAWTPWLFLGAMRLRPKRGVRWWPFVLAATMALFCGHPQYLALTLVFLVPFLMVERLAVWIFARYSAKRVARSSAILVARIAACLAIAGAISAAQLLPTQELSELSERIWPYPDPHAPSLNDDHRAEPGAPPKIHPIEHLKSLFVPRYYNHLAGGPGRPIGYTELGMYMGLVTAPLALIGAISISFSRRQKPFLLGVISTAVLSIWYAFGSIKVGGRYGTEVGIAPLIHMLVPYLAHSRGSARALNIFTLMLALLAAHGATVLLQSLTRRPISRKVGLAAQFIPAIILCIDLGITHRPELISRLCPAELLERAGITNTNLNLARVYRFTQNDGDLYLADDKESLIERARWLMPNNPAEIAHRSEAISTLDGYEEGLLPTRAAANFARAYNRNLRSDSPDAALLALMGCNQMLTSFNLPPSSAWQPDSRSEIDVQQRVLSAWKFILHKSGEWVHPSHHFAKSRYPAALMVDEETLTSASGILARFPEYVFGRSLSWRGREPLNRELVRHPFQNLTPEAFEAAAKRVPLGKILVKPNGIAFNQRTEGSDAAPQEILVLQSAYPGWKYFPVAHSSLSIPLRARSPIFSSFTFPPSKEFRLAGSSEIRFSPFSFRLGLFISLTALTAALLPKLFRDVFRFRRKRSLTVWSG